MERGELRPVFVSRGIGYSGLNLRLHCPAEVALLALRATVPICGLLIQRDHNSARQLLHRAGLARAAV